MCVCACVCVCVCVCVFAQIGCLSRLMVATRFSDGRAQGTRYCPCAFVIMLILRVLIETEPLLCFCVAEVVHLKTRSQFCSFEFCLPWNEAKN